MVIKAISCIPFPSQVAFMPYRVNGQYIMEGLASSFLFSMGGLGFIILDKSNAVGMSKLNRFLLLFLGFVCVLVSFFTCRVFMRMKLPWVSLFFFLLTARFTRFTGECILLTNPMFMVQGPDCLYPPPPHCHIEDWLLKITKDKVNKISLLCMTSLENNFLVIRDSCNWITHIKSKWGQFEIFCSGSASWAVRKINDLAFPFSHKSKKPAVINERCGNSKIAENSWWWSQLNPGN